MRVILAETAGFCMGVDLALTKLNQLLEESGGRAAAGGLYTFGPIIHNPQVLERYAAKGVRVAKSPEDIPAGASVVIRAHGVPREVEEALVATGVRVVDATCPRVKKAQVLIRRYTADGRTLLLYGEADHPEVQGLLSYAEGPRLVFGDLAEFEALDLPPGRYALAAQTTQDKAVFTEIIARLQARDDVALEVLETICDATKLRQAEAVEIARTVDAMVVVGGRMSGNTRRLVQVCEAAGTDCFPVEVPEELPLDRLRGKSTVGLTAGASTPADLIAAVRRTLEAL